MTGKVEKNKKGWQMMKIFTYKDGYDGQFYKLKFMFTNTNGRIGIVLVSENGIPFGLLTANLGTTHGVVFPLASTEFLDWLEEIGAGNYLGVDEVRGFNAFPLFKFDKEFLRNVNTEQFDKFFAGVE